MTHVSHLLFQYQQSFIYNLAVIMTRFKYYFVDEVISTAFSGLSNINFINSLLIEIFFS